MAIKDFLNAVIEYETPRYVKVCTEILILKDIYT